jgi:ABC-2 type transport system ATP-binding protein
LELKNVRKQFPGFLLDNINLSLPCGYIMGLVGSNGAGKTTTIQLILNMFERDGGEVLVFGKDNVKDEKGVKQEIGVVFDSSVYAEAWTVRDTEKAVSVFYENWDHDVFTDMTQRFELPPNKKIKDFSRGMQMKLMLACAFSHDARLLILDEPTSGLDPVARDSFLEILQEYIRDGERSVLFSTHITTDLERVADYITLINGGRLFYTGSMDDLRATYRMVKGRPGDLTPQREQSIMGIRKTERNFEGLIRVTDAANFEGCILEPATIDAIVICVSREGQKNE